MTLSLQTRQGTRVNAIIYPVAIGLAIKNFLRKNWHIECTITFAAIFILKSILTIFFLLLIGQAFGQTDSFLQSLIDSVKVEVSKPSSAKESQKRTIQDTILLKKDTTKLKRDTTRATTLFPDSASLSKKIKTKALTDSLQKDTLTSVASVIPVLNSKPLSWQEDTAFTRLLELPIAGAKAQSFFKNGDIHLPQQKDYLFYLLVGIVLLLAIIKRSFPKYFQNLFHLMLQASFRQKQTREQMMQQILPSLLMNLLFILVGGLFIALLAEIRQWLNISFWRLTLYSIAMLALVYIFKYLVIQFMGWVFNAKEQASTYVFIVFLINKVAGLALLPLLLLFAFSTGYIQEIVTTIAACLVILLLLFRYIVSLTIIRGAVSIHLLHFFIYLCGLELMPMLIMYKVMFSYVGKIN